MRTDCSTREGARPVEARDFAAPSARALVDRRDQMSREALLRRIAVEYEELPSLRLTIAQARRLFALRDDICARVLASLIAAHVLDRDADGAFVRSHSRI